MPHLSRRALCGMLAAAALARQAAADDNWHSVDVTGSVPPLSFEMTDASTGKSVTAADFRGKLAMLYLGYTFCPDVCPLTMGRIADVLARLGKQAQHVQVLFVTVDPARDTVPVLHDYTAAFGPEFVGLRGDADDVARIARRYRLAYSVTPATATTPYEVTHSSAVYVFDRDGAARLLVPSLASTTPDVAGTVDDLDRLLGGDSHRGWLSSLLSVL